ncbi:hypothetical protein DPMN_164821 [Dreissena polymorpha]|uniref:Uncharacterized protein n=1 Tax=Dreissena polymorpha TaxID=45954 RepID=A0A9D4IVZ8_DREPO|nr:hypothetical protein DPMN_164821 [Dreissena polymorpha]
MLMVLMLAHLLSGSLMQSVDKQYLSTDLASPVKAVTRRVIRDLHTDAANAPDHFLRNVRFQEMIHTLLESEQSLVAICQDISCSETKYLGKLEQKLAARCLEISCSSTKHLLKYDKTLAAMGPDICCSEIKNKLQCVKAFVSVRPNISCSVTEHKPVCDRANAAE